jgi:phage terminase large subunit-like protein
MGELLGDVEDALWSRELIESHRIRAINRDQLVRVVVAVDPASTSGSRSNDTGVIVCGIDGAGTATSWTT